MKSIYFMLVIALMASCNSNNSSSSKLADIVSSHMDTTVAPGDDFFNYANGQWIKDNPIPASESGWGIFNLVEDENLNRIKRISEEATSTEAKTGSATQQIGDFFSAGMDSANIEKNDFHPLDPILNQIKSIQSLPELFTCMNNLQKHGVDAMYSMGVYQDMKNSDKNFLYISQGGLGLPDRDYYFNTDSRTTSIRNEYPTHIAIMLNMLLNDETKAKVAALQVFNLEKQMAESHKKLEDLRDPYANYNKMAVADLNKLISGMDWSKEFQALGIKTDSVIVGQPEYLKKLNSLFTTANIEAWKNYLTYQTLTEYAPFLSTRFEIANFEFYGKLLSGSKEQRPRWKRVLNAQENALGDALGQLYVKEYFPEKTKKRYEDLVDQIVISYREHIQKLPWMSDSTKQKAISKLNSIKRKIGYPNKWRDYSSMKITQDSYCRNVIEGNLWQFNYGINKLGKPVDRNEWSMTPQTYNAYYNPSNNEIVLPAAIFTAPGYKDEDLDDAVVYGYVGASTIGHELTHGFDDEGRQFDQNGNLKNWWSKEDEANFKKRAQMLVDQFNAYVVLDSLHANGEASLGENIADLGGVIIGLDAFKKTKQFQENKKLAGLTPLQRYFMGYAYGWMQTRTDAKTASLLLSDVHAPIFLRVLGPMSNCDEWYTAFNVTEKNKMYRKPEDRVRIW